MCMRKHYKQTITNICIYGSHENDIGKKKRNVSITISFNGNQEKSRICNDVKWKFLV